MNLTRGFVISEPGSSTSISNELIPILEGARLPVDNVVSSHASRSGEAQVTYFKLFLVSPPQWKKISVSFIVERYKSPRCFPIPSTSPGFRSMNQLTQTTLPQTTLAQSAFAQSTLPHYIVINMNLPSCCGSYCGVLFPLNANGAYNNPRDGGKTLVTFRLTGSSTCGIPVAKVLRGDLEGLIERDALAELNPKANSIRLRIEVGSLSPARPSYTTS